LAILLDGKKVAARVTAEVKEALAGLKKGAPRLASIRVGQTAAMDLYLKSQARLAGELGIAYQDEVLPADATQRQVEDVIAGFNKDAATTGIILQMPAPAALRPEALRRAIAPQKDAEGVHPAHLGEVVLGKARVAPCTAAACLEILKHYEIPLRGREAVVVGHSEIVGKPLSMMLLDEFATTTVCHIATSEAGQLEEHVRRADVLVVAVGCAQMIKGAWIKEGAAVVDVGINRSAQGIVGDVEFEAASRRAGWITPVPGGVGPVTVAMLMRNVVELLKDRPTA